jgi:hypothetical protein
MTTNIHTDGIETFCNQIMHAVADYAARTGNRVVDYEQASEVLKSEVKDFFFGDNYKDERECLLLGTVHQGYIITSIVASVLLKIKWTTPAA